MTEQKFRELLSKYFKGSLTEEEAELLHQFDRKMLENKPLFFKNKSHQLSVQSALYKFVKKELNTRQRISWRVAASFLLLIGLGISVSYLTSNKLYAPTNVTFSTNWGQQHVITLPDSSIVRLNAGSSLSYPKQFDLSKRKVTLTGEAFFDVKKADIPFIINTDEVTTTVLGTSFNIKTSDKKDIVITVASGKVRVSNNINSEVLLPKQQAIYKRDSKHFIKNEVSLQKYIDWKDGVLRFDNQTIAEAAIELEKWYNVSIKVLNNNIGNCRFSGKFNNETLPTILNSLTHLKQGMTYKVSESGVVIITGKCN